MLLPVAANAAPISFDWTWTGSSGYSAAGTMSYSDTLAGTGVITAGSISTFTIEGFSGTTSLFTWDLATGAQSNPFQLSFDTNSLQLVFGGFYPTASDSVVWGDDGGVGALICGTGNCGLTGPFGGFVGFRDVADKSQFVFTQVKSVPAPGALALLCLGLLGMGFARQMKQV